MMITIRKAVSSDLSAIAQITEDTFQEHIQPGVTRLQNNLLLVAELQGVVVGFAANFQTRSAYGEGRFELDLLAVDPSARGRGVGYSLLSGCIQRASVSSADVLRALVRADNLAMSQLCARGGLQRSAQPYVLYIARPPRPPRRVRGRQSVRAGHLVSVDTLTYRGIWLEGDLSQAAIAQAQQIARAENRSRIGALVPTADAPVAALLSENGFAAVGTFYWWSSSL
ncbi:MAG: GNAT family N-acetyltransferase [Chloroflexi bacterium]|nr:GNAT family N-acetyltransferase [Chloroflexota bacterium]MYA92156.1 GNAT family N-acetyltransferase [Chloroflexota bacterium]MYE79176.1 GNAT family N-acetyltransferase [Chloroflexota bacterium]MYH64231.1 GNAT family N-acetyltransferase [Chloroflexota bacterium]